MSNNHLIYYNVYLLLVFNKLVLALTVSFSEKRARLQTSIKFRLQLAVIVKRVPRTTSIYHKMTEI